MKNWRWILGGVLVIALLTVHFLIPLPPQYNVIKLFLIFAMSIFIMIASSDYLVGSIQDYSEKTRIPHFLVGFVIISLATTVPDISAGIFAALEDAGELIIGDTFSQVFIDITILIGITAIFAKRVSLKEGHLDWKNIFLIFGFLMFPLFFGLDGTFSRWEGATMLGLFLVYMLFNTWKEIRLAHVVKDIAFKKIWEDILVFGLAFATIMMSARWMVISAKEIAHVFSISPFIVGLILLGFCNALPEITFTIKTVRRGITDMGLAIPLAQF